MSATPLLTFVCLASYEKGQAFLRQLKQLGCRVILITTVDLQDAPWPHESLDDIFYMPDLYHREDVIHGISYLARSVSIDRIVPLDDFDVETAAMLREHLRVPGMGDTTARYFRDKLAMRVKAQEHDILVPPFVPVLNYERLRDFMSRVPAPWVLKPRSEASSLGIKKIHSPDELWQALDGLGDRQSFYVLEKFVAGDVYHVDTLISERQMLFAEVHKYANPPLAVMSGGGLFSSMTLERESEETDILRQKTEELLSALGLVYGASHTEFIKSHENGQFYFLETAARVAGANIAEMVEAAAGINLWQEWAKIEVSSALKQPYTLPTSRQDYAGILISLARQEYPDTSAYTDPEIVWRLNRKHHAGLIVSSPQRERIQHLLTGYMERFYQDFFATLPPSEKPTS